MDMKTKIEEFIKKGWRLGPFILVPGVLLGIICLGFAYFLPKCAELIGNDASIPRLTTIALGISTNAWQWMGGVLIVGSVVSGIALMNYRVSWITLILIKMATSAVVLAVGVFFVLGIYRPLLGSIVDG